MSLRARDFPVGSLERLKLVAPQRILARDDQRDTICSGVSLVGKSAGYKPPILKQTNNPQTITFFLPTLANGSKGGGAAFDVRFAVRGYDSQGFLREEVFRKHCESKLGTSDPEAFAAYTTRTMWRWVTEIEMLEYTSGGGPIDGLYVGHAIGSIVTGFYWSHGGTTYDIGEGRGPIDRIVVANREDNTLDVLDPGEWTYTPEDGRLHVQRSGLWDDTVDLYVVDHPQGRL